MRRTTPKRGATTDWDTLARLDPLWAICSRSETRGGRWDRNAFFATGEDEIARVLARPEARPAQFGRALDFGCGVGRVTRALARRFGTCYALDSSAAMIDAARRLNPDCANCVFVYRGADDLSEVEAESIDFVYSTFVLQHLPRERVLRYIREFVRVARPGGAIVFQLPERLPLRRRLQPRRRLYRQLRRLGLAEAWLYRTARLHPIGMISVRRHRVEAAVADAGAIIVATEGVDPTSPIAGLRYFVRRPA